MSLILDYVPWWVWPTLIAAGLAVTFPWWSPLWLAAPRWLKALLAFAAAVFAAYSAGRYRGATNERQRQKDADAQATKRRLETNAQVNNLPPGDRDKQLNRWMRD
jgi:hypothetical protein